jgi:hypothetical protein
VAQGFSPHTCAHTVLFNLAKDRIIGKDFRGYFSAENVPKLRAVQAQVYRSGESVKLLRDQCVVERGNTPIGLVLYQHHRKQ